MTTNNENSTSGAGPLPCAVVADLLPAYIEGLTGPETSALMAEHLEGCAGCRAPWEQMRRDDDAVLGNAPAKNAAEREAGAGFLQKLRRKNHTVVAVSVAAVLLMVLVGYYLSVHIAPFPLAEVSVGERYQLADGRVYLQLVTAGDLAALPGYSFRSVVAQRAEGGAGLELQYGYTLTSRLGLSPEPGLYKKYHHIINPNGPRSLEAIYLAGYGGGERVLLWQRGDELPAAPYSIESYSAGEPLWTTEGILSISGVGADDPDATRQMAAQMPF